MKKWLRHPGSRIFFLGLVSAGLAVALFEPLSGCSSDDANPAGAAAHGGGVGAQGGAAASGAGGHGAQATGGGFVIGGFGQGGTLVGGACAGDVQEAEMLPMDMYIMLDRSLSMVEMTAAGGAGGGAAMTKWDAVKEALLGFVADDQSVGLGVGIQYFPANPPCEQDGDCSGTYCYLNACNNTMAPEPCQSDDDCPTQASDTCVPLGQCGPASCTNVGGDCGGGLGTCTAVTQSVCVIDDICPVSQYSTPDVPIGVLPGATADLTSSLGAVWPAPIPYGLTPMGPALQGAIDYATAWKTDNPDHTVIAVLATDGTPTWCAPSGQSAVAAIAAVGLAEAGIQTFTIGVFAPGDTEGEETVEAIAEQGGGEAFIVDQSQNVTQQFIDALNTIRGAALDCEFEIPDPPPGETLDYNKVNVEFTDGDGVTTTIPYVGHESNCHPVHGGWYYDVNPASETPSRIIVCDVTCDLFKQTIGGTVEIRLGCETVIEIPE